MALAKCKECGEQVSTKAKNCPKCGAKAPRKTSIATWLVLIFIILVIYAGSQTPTSSVSPSGSSRQVVQSAASNSNQQTSEKAPSPKPSWSHFTSKDEMTGAKTAYAASPRVSATERMRFPYSDTKAWLGVGCDGKNEWAYIGFTNAPNLNDTETEDGYNRIWARVKWDGEMDKLSLTQEWGAAFIHFSDNHAAIANIAESRSVLVELNWHGNGRTYFRFPLNGSSAALQAIRQACAH